MWDRSKSIPYDSESWNIDKMISLPKFNGRSSEITRIASKSLASDHQKKTSGRGEHPLEQAVAAMIYAVHDSG